MKEKAFTPLEIRSNKFNVRSPKGGLSLTGFTILELLVVIVIIGLLLAIILPVFGRVREGAKNAQCANNLRQHGIAWYLYLGDHDDHFPKYDSLISGMHTFGGKKGYTHDDASAAEHRVLNRYLDIYSDTTPNVYLFQCPFDTKADADSDCEKEGLSTFDCYGTSYTFNRRIIGYDPDDPGTCGPGTDGMSNARPRPLMTITRSHSKVYLECDEGTSMPGHRGSGDSGNDTLLMVLFLDGHVKGPIKFGSFETYIIDPNAEVLLDPNGTCEWWD